MTGRWLTVSRTITRIWAETGRLLTGDDVLRLGRRTGAWGLIVETSHEHTRVLEQSVTDHIAWLTAPKGEKAAVRRASKTYTPNDERDEH